HGALGVVAVGLRPAEVGEEPVAEVLRHVAAEAPDDLGGALLVRLHHFAPLLGIEVRRELRRAYQLAAQHGELPSHALGGPRRRPRRIWLVPQGARRCQRRREGAVELAWGRCWAGSLVPAIWIPQAADATLGCTTAETIDTSTHRLDLLAHLAVCSPRAALFMLRRLAPATRAAPSCRP